MVLTFVPRKLIYQALQTGWKLVPNYDSPHDWAVLMWRQAN